jgi:uncharacterized repeat protein (TIGR01451 family)
VTAAIGAATLTGTATAATTIREAAGPNGAAIQAAVDAFRADLGNPLNGSVPGSQPSGRRDINWDGVPDGDAAPGRLPGDFFNKIAPRGAVFSIGTGTGFQVSADAANPSATPVRFGNVNATYPTAFATFSAERLFAPLGTTTTVVDFRVAGSDTPAGVRGFGAVFTDVDVAGSSRIELLDANGDVLTSRDAPAAPGDGSLSFVGVSFDQAVVSRVRITSGNAALGPNDVTQGGASDIVALDDFIYGEPVAQVVADLAVSVSGPATAVAGQDATYTTTVRNAGGIAAKDVRVTPPAPVGAQIVSQGATTLGTLAPGQSATVTTVVRGTAAGTLTAVATATTSSPDASAANDTAQTTTAVSAAPPPPPERLTSPQAIIEPGRILASPVTGLTAVRLACPAGGPACTGTLTLLRAGRAAGSAPLRLRAGSIALVRVRLGVQTRRLLARGLTVPLTARARTAAPGRDGSTTTARLTARRR